MFKRLTFIFIAAVLSVTAHAQKDSEGKIISEPVIVADTTAFTPGKAFTVGIHFKLSNGWHLYWQWPGSVGKPLTIEWDLPDGWKADDIQWPLPELLADSEGGRFYGYEHEVVFPVVITPGEKPTSGSAKITAKLDWLACKTECVPGKADITLNLPIGSPAPANAELFTKWRAQLPQNSPAPTQDVKVSSVGKQLSVRVGGLDKALGVEFSPLPPANFSGNFDYGSKLASETNADGARTFSYKFESDLPGWGGLLVVKGADGVRRGWYVGGENSGAAGSAQSTAQKKSDEIVGDDGGWNPFDDIAKDIASKPSSSFLALLLQGFLGGLLLNLMPCVLPVISLKIFGFLQQAGEAKDRVFKLGLAFCAGVFAFFMILAVAIVALASFGKTLGWGEQFSNPLLLTAMLGIVFLFGLSLLGVFEITLGGGASSKLSELSSKEGPGGAFMHGLFTTLLGTSCTAPLVGPVIGTAITRPGAEVFALFAAIATGLSLPYFLLTWKPAWMRYLPKPGTWMVRFKQVLGFVMLALVVWLLGSLPATSAIVMAASFLLVLGFGAWLLGTYHDSRWSLPFTIALAIGGWFLFVQGKVNVAADPGAAEGANAQGVDWEPFSIPRMREALEAGQPVFVDFTAKWCLNCKAYENLVINTAPVTAALKAKNVVTIRADYTNRPAIIDAQLKKCGRAGVPLYVLFRKRGDYWLADGLTQGELLKQLNKP